MATYHFSWDLEFFGYLAPGTSTQGFLRIYARLIASSFLFLAGFSLVLAHYPKIRFAPFLRRLGVIVAAAAVITWGLIRASRAKSTFLNWLLVWWPLGLLGGWLWPSESRN